MHRSILTTNFQAERSQEGRLNLAGVANTGGIMRSGRMIQPAALKRYAAENPRPDRPLMLNHGKGTSPIKTIGRVERVEYDERTGLSFFGFIATGTALSDDVAKLVEQGALKEISVGWDADDFRTIHRDDAAVPASVRAEMVRTGVDEVEAHMEFHLNEISIVDLSDDPNARLVADGEGGLAERLDRIEAAIERLSSPEAHADLAKVLAEHDAAFAAELRKLRSFTADGLEEIDIRADMNLNPFNEAMDRLEAAAGGSDE